MDCQIREEIEMSEDTGKKAILFDVDDTLYDQTAPFKEAYAQYFGNEPAIPAEVIYPVTRKYSDQVYSQPWQDGLQWKSFIYTGAESI